MIYSDSRFRGAADLSGTWDFAWLGADVDLSDKAVKGARMLAGLVFTDTASVPGCFDTVPGQAGVRGTAAYRTRLPDVAPGKVELVHLGGLGVWAAVYQGDRRVHVHRSPYLAFTVQLDPTGPRELTVVLDNRFSEERSPLQENYFDFYAYGGIFRPVRHLTLPEQHVIRTRVTTEGLDPAAVRVRITTSQHASAPLVLAINGEEVLKDRTDATNADQDFVLNVPNLERWTPESPHMHELRVQVGADEMVVPFGLRTIACEGQQILLNGTPIELFGWNRHETHPQFGPALPLQQLEQDIRLMKAAGANFVRGSHYPQDSRFLDLCDRMGMLVWEESIGWQQEARHYANPDYVSLVTEQQREMILGHANHPSIVMWGFQNETHSELPEARPLMEGLAAVTRESDPTRPVTFGTCRFPNDVCMDLVDVVSINLYPGWYASDTEAYRPLEEIGTRLETLERNLRAQGQHTKPVILSEIGAGAIYGWRDSHAGHWSEQYQTDYLLEVCAQFESRSWIAGLALWQFCDGRTYGSSRALGRPRTFNNKGIVDEYRRPKQAYTEVARSRLKKSR